MATRAGPYGDWYLWRDPAGRDRRGRPRPPNNWLSWFGGSGWTWDEGRQQFYFHTFLAEQPDLNWRNPAVPDAQLAMVRGWLDRGVDGFRLDVFNTFYKHADFVANPPAGLRRQAWDRQRHVHDQNQPELVAFLARFRAEVDARPGRMTVGELFGGGAETAASFAADRHLIFDFVLLERPWSAAAFGAAIERVERAFGPVRWPTVVLSNHDRPRHASRLARALGDEHRDAVAKAAAVILLTLRGTPFLYYGEELGLGDIAVRREEAIDPPARRASLFFPWWNRDGCRSPMPWTGEPNAGFTSPGVRTWLPLAPDAGTRNVAAQAADPDSVLSTYRRLLATRRSLGALQDGHVPPCRHGPGRRPRLDPGGRRRRGPRRRQLLAASGGRRARRRGRQRGLGQGRRDPSGAGAADRCRAAAVVAPARGRDRDAARLTTGAATIRAQSALPCRGGLRAARVPAPSGG